MSRRNKLITIIVILILIGLGLGLYFGLKNNSNSSIPQTPPLNIPLHTIDKWSPTMCNKYLEACQDNINKGLISNTAMAGCLEMMKVHECQI
jgi:hypothetical protein